MTTRHGISNADELYRGNAYHAPYNSPLGRRGIIMSHVVFVDLGAPDILDVDGICAAQAVAGAADLTINGALASGGAVTLDVPRALEIDSSGAGDTSQSVTITGTDEYGEALVETISFNGTTAVSGKKAFKTVTQVAASASMAGNATVGTTDILGLPFKLAKASDIIAFNADGSVEDATIAVAVTTDPATATTGDTRGTVVPTTATDGSVNFGVLMKVDASTKVAGFGVDQYGG